MYRFIYTPGRGRSKIYGISGYENTYFKKMCMIGTEEHNNELMTMNAVSMICDKDQII